MNDEFPNTDADVCEAFYQELHAPPPDGIGAEVEHASSVSRTYQRRHWGAVEYLPYMDLHRRAYRGQ